MINSESNSYSSTQSRFEEYLMFDEVKNGRKITNFLEFMDEKNIEDHKVHTPLRNY